MVAIDSAIGNKKTKKSNRDTKVDLEVQPNTATTALASHWPTTTTSTLMSAFLVSVSVCRPLTRISSGKLLLFRIQLPSCIPCAESMILSVKLFKDIQDILMYEEFLAMDDFDNN